MMCDVFKDMGHDVHIVARTEKKTHANVKVPILDPETARPVLIPAKVEASSKLTHHPLRKIGKFQPLKFITPNDISLHAIPVIYWGDHFLTPWAPEVVEMMKEADYVFCDSVPAYSPVSYRYGKGNSDEVDIVPIEDLWVNTSGSMRQLPTGEVIKTPSESVYVFSGTHSKSKWSKVKHLIRHKYKGKLIKINALAGCVDVSPNHSIILNGSIADAETAKVGDNVSIPVLTELVKKRYGLFIGTEELAWMYGMFTAEGSLHGHPRQKTKEDPAPSISIIGMDKKNIEKCRSLFVTYFNRPSCLTKDEDLFRAWLYGYKIYAFFKKHFYTIGKNKKVPQSILNAPKNIQKAFLEGYFAGDGSVDKKLSWQFQTCSTKSQTLAMGIIYLIQRVTGQSFSVGTRIDKPNMIRLCFNKKPQNRENRNEIRKVSKTEYEGYLYDIETEDHVFCTGVGPVRVHNTEMYVRLETSLDIADKHIQYVHFPTQGLTPVLGREPRMLWANSSFTQSWIRIRWGYNNQNYHKLGKKYATVKMPRQIYQSEVVHPPLYIEDYKNNNGFDDRPYDVVMFARLGDDKFTVAGFLNEHFKLLTMGALSPVKQPGQKKEDVFKPKGELHATVTFKQVIQLLKQAKVYVHGKGFGSTRAGGESLPEHFGITVCEAMASGCPVIVPRRGGCWTDISLLGKHTLGYSSLKELKFHVDMLTKNKEEWMKWHKLGLERVEAFDAEKLKPRLKQLLD